jgi:hypothetical protein
MVVVNAQSYPHAPFRPAQARWLSLTAVMHIEQSHIIIDEVEQADHNDETK